MTQEEKQLLLKDLCSRLPYGVMLNVPTIDGSENKKLVSIVNEDDGVPCAAVYSNEEKKSDGSLISYAKTIYAICDVLPYLRPMDTMTEKEKEELCKLCDFEKSYNDRDYFSHYGIEIISEYCVNGEKIVESIINYNVIDFFYAHHLDWRGLIPMGLALEAKEGMYNYENN